MNHPISIAKYRETSPAGFPYADSRCVKQGSRPMGYLRGGGTWDIVTLYHLPISYSLAFGVPTYID